MSNLIPVLSGGASSDLTKRKKMSAIHSHIEERADGSKETIEKRIDFSDDRFMQGDQWLYNPEQADKDSDDAHFREDKSQLTVRERHIIEDGQGNKTIDEKVMTTDDYWSSHGVKLIADGPNREPDKRITLISDFATQKDIFALIGEDRKLLTEGDK